jgi:hypothetical protein
MKGFSTESLDDAKSHCTATVLFPHPGYRQKLEPQQKDGEVSSKR